MKKIVYFTIISSMIGAGIISINMGGFQLSLFRGLIVLLSLVSILEILLRNKKIPIKIREDNKYSIKFMFIWLSYAFFSLAWVKDYNGWLKAIYFIALGFLSILILKKYLRNKKDILTSFRVIFPMIVFHNLLGWYEVITGNYLFLLDNRVIKYLKYNYPVSTFGNTNDYAVFMMFSFFVLYICLINSSKFITKFIYMSAMVSSIGLLLSTGSRAVLLGLIIGLLVLAIYSIQRKKTRRIVLSLLLSLFFVILLNPNILLDLFSNIDNMLSFDFSQQSGSEFVRINLIRNGFDFLISTFGFGTGAGNIEYWMANFGTYNTGGVLNIHNWWMEILVGYGLIIFILYITFYTKLFASMHKKFKSANNRTDMTISLGIMSIMSGYIVASISSSSNMSSEWLWVFWAIAIAYQGMTLSNNNQE